MSGKWFAYGVGIDCHREMVWACVLRLVYDTGKQKRDICKFATDPHGLAAMRAWLEERVPAPNRRVLVESTSTYHFPILRALPQWVHIVINPKLVGSAKRIGMSVTRLTNALKTRMCLFGINHAFSAKHNVGFKLFRHMCLGEVPPRELVRNRRHWAAAEFDQAVMALPQRVRELNRLQLAEVDALLQQRAKVFEIVMACPPPGALATLQTVPFIRTTAACCFLAEVGFVARRRFNSVKAVIAFAGFDPSKRVSADNVTSHLPCAGSKLMRRCFSQVAGGALLSKHPLAKMGAAVAERAGKRGWFAARNAVARKLVRWCAAVHVSGRPFREGYHHGKDEAAGNHADAEWATDWALGGDLFLDEGIAPPAGWDSPGSEEAHWFWGEGSLGDAEG